MKRIIKEGITNENIEWRSLEVLKELSSSPNKIDYYQRKNTGFN